MTENQDYLAGKTEPQDPPFKGLWEVILLNDDIHRYTDVVEWLQKAMPCTPKMAGDLVNWAHYKGRATVCVSSRDKCEKVALALSQYGLQVRLEQSGKQIQDQYHWTALAICIAMLCYLLWFLHLVPFH